jgi:hypothetical protein
VAPPEPPYTVELTITRITSQSGTWSSATAWAVASSTTSSRWMAPSPQKVASK